MLKHRIIPTLLSRNGSLVKGRGFKSDRVIGHVLQAARIHQARNVDELLIFDVAATPERRGPDLKLIEQITDECFMPISVGGGVCSVGDVVDLLHAGADKVVIGSMATTDLWLVKAAAEKVGSQAISVSIDVFGGVALMSGCGRVGVNLDPMWMAHATTVAGAGEIILQSVDLDGTMLGYDHALIAAVSRAVTIPVVASGGCKDVMDMEHAIACGASAVAAGALFAFTGVTPRQAAIELKAMGVATRVDA